MQTCEKVFSELKNNSAFNTILFDKKILPPYRKQKSRNTCTVKTVRNFMSDCKSDGAIIVSPKTGEGTRHESLANK